MARVATEKKKRRKKEWKKKKKKKILRSGKGEKTRPVRSSFFSPFNIAARRRLHAYKEQPVSC